MVIALILLIGATAATGLALTIDAFWGVAWMQSLHNALADGLLLLVGAHLAGVMLASFRHRENLVVAMIHGRKRAAGRNDVA
jgi:cytochrome b